MKNKIFSGIISKLDEIREIEHLTDKEIQILSTPKRISRSKIRIGGKNLPAWRILFNDSLGPGKGGIRFHPEVSEDEIVSLSFWMMLKNSLAGIPYGGAKGGVKFDPKNASPKTLETVSRKYVSAFYKVLGQDKDIPAPDVYTNSQTMAWMLDEYEKKTGHHEPGMITGKPLELQGCVLRSDATAKGGFIITEEMAREFNLKKRNLKIAVQGFGNAGLNLARMLWENNFKIAAVSDSKGGIYNKNGLNIKNVIKAKSEKGLVSEHKKGERIINGELLKLPVDILILAALENQITKDNADKIKAKYVIEIANGPIGYEADKILFNKGVVIAPDILANAGGVVASYFEWSQNKTGNILDRKYLEKLFRQKMITSWSKVVTINKKHGNKIDLRTAAYLIAIKRILDTEKLRGRI
ncbi:MAG: Glu/Leu/Phe/Val dehydrogenase [Patescibacteria group bacterium]|nr:Glu/Leu/Phe/Val dehydrogenase [Patescibacteria group bacterium]